MGWGQIVLKRRWFSSGMDHLAGENSNGENLKCRDHIFGLYVLMKA